MSRSFTAVNWDRYSHQQLWSMVMNADPKTIQATADDAARLANGLGDAADSIKNVLDRLTSSWSGPTADAAAETFTRMLDWADNAANTAGDIGHRLSRFAITTNNARDQMPMPPTAESSAQPSTATTQATESTSSKDHAVRVMSHYADNAAEIYDGMPTFTAPPRVAGVAYPEPAPEPAAATTTASGSPTDEPPATTAPAAFEPLDFASAAQSTTPAGFATAAPLSGLLPGVPDASFGGVLGALPGNVATGLPVLGLNSGAATGSGVPTEEGPWSEPTAVEGEPAAWNGYGPVTRTAGRRGEQDGQYRSRYTKADLVGDLPPACPPVIGG